MLTCDQINPDNAAFYSDDVSQSVAHCVRADDGAHVTVDMLRNSDVAMVLWRLPRKPHVFRQKLVDLFGAPPAFLFVNHPLGAELCGSKAFLADSEISKLCPPLRLCATIAETREFYAQQRDNGIVLKPLDRCGGDGVLWVQSEEQLDDLVAKDAIPLPCIAMMFLKNVSQGDKRIICVGK